MSTAMTIDDGAGVFSRVLVGVDGSPEALEAVRQATRLRSTDVGLTLLAAWELAPPVVTPLAPATYAPDEDEPRSRAQAALQEARERLELDPLHAEVVRGFAWQALIDEVERRYHTLVAVGPHRGGRVSGIVAGSTATELLHKAPCSVLVARAGDESFPSRIVVGIDGSPQSVAAFAAAGYLARRYGAELHPLVARGGRAVDAGEFGALVTDYEYSKDDPVRALAGAAADADLLVVGSRGLHGLKALGSVSERVAHEAPCSVLVVRHASGG